MTRVLFISPHPDDETLGCGGTILKHKAVGDEIHWLIMTNILVKDGYDEERVKTRQKEIDIVAGEYGFDNVYKLDLPAAKLDAIDRSRLIKAVSDVICKVMPAAVYLPYRNDVHSDHKFTFDAVISSTKTFRSPFIKRMLAYEVISETEFSTSLQGNPFSPNSFSNIEGYMERKIEIMKLYKGELGEHPFPRSIDNIKALATFRGATAGMNYAEAFMVLKEAW